MINTLYYLAVNGDGRHAVIGNQMPVDSCLLARVVISYSITAAAVVKSRVCVCVCVPQ